MLNLPQKSIVNIKKVLLRRQKEVKEQLKAIEKDDPVTADGLAPEAGESGTDSWMAEAHARLTSLKNDLKDSSGKIAKALLRLRKGTYGKCEKCGKDIDAARLEAMPTANLCVSCAKSKKK